MLTARQHPSPHRFLAKRATGRSSPPDEARPRPRPPAHHPPAQQTRGLPGSSTSTPGPGIADQFAATPRFAFNHGRPRTQAPVTTTDGNGDGAGAQPSALPQVLRGRRAEDVEVSSPPSPGSPRIPGDRGQDDDDDDDDDDDEMLEILPTTENVGNQSLDETIAEHHVLPFSPKRRKIQHFQPSAPEIPPTPTTIPSFHRPPPPPSPPLAVPHLPPSATKPRFIPSRASSPPPSLSSLSPATAHHPPTFLRPPPATTAPASGSAHPAAPLPETFSPHRRGHKFVPGGLALTLQTWVLETGQAALQSRRARAALSSSSALRAGADFVLTARVEEIFGDDGGRGEGFAVTARAEGRNLLFAPTGAGAAESGLEVGCMVGVRAPVWEVRGGDGTSWTVAADWRVLASSSSSSSSVLV
nr:hypothetical protein CFP56_21070 [Quercus suber]